MENKAIYAGSFDPFTNGHMTILEKTLKIFPSVTVLLANNSSKTRTWDAMEMLSAIRKCLDKTFPGKCLYVDYTDGYVADYCESHGARYLVRGLRNNMDFMYEEEIAKVNKELNWKLETIYLRADNDIISSSMIRGFIAGGKSAYKYVPEEIYDLIDIQKD